MNAKQHKDNLARAKELKAKIMGEVKKKAPVDPVDRVQGLKRTIEVMRSEIPEKKIKSILKNSSSTTTTTTVVSSIEVAQETNEPPKSNSAIPDDFFDSKSKQITSKEPPVENMQVDDPLPEGFFDDPVKDAKIRHQEYKDPVEEEWEKFQKEIKEAEAESKVIINVEHEEATVERQLDEIDEQIRNWSR